MSGRNDWTRLTVAALLLMEKSLRRLITRGSDDMLKRLAILMALVSASSTAWADARSECADWKNTPPDRSIATCSEVIRRDARAAWAYNNRGLAYYNKKDYDRAIADYNRAIEIDPKYALAYNNRGLVYYNKTDYERAIADYKKAIEIDPKQALAYNNLANVYQAQGRYVDAEPLYKRSLAIREKALGPDHLDVGRSLNSLGTFVPRSRRRYADAEPPYKRALSMREKALGPDHLDVAQSLHNLAWLYHQMGRYPDAEPLYKRALAIREKVLGPDHRDVAQSLNNLAISYQARAGTLRPSHSSSAHWQSAKRRWGPTIAMWLRASTTWRGYTKQLGRYADAEPLYKRSLAIREKALGPDHPEVGRTLNNLAIYTNTGPLR